MVLMSETTRQVILLELTVSWEGQMEEAFERKRAKYEELASVCRSKGWRTCCDPIEVGCRGFRGNLFTCNLNLYITANGFPPGAWVQTPNRSMGEGVVMQDPSGLAMDVDRGDRNEGLSVRRALVAQ
ncbi:hypothetical protein NFI96_019477, partial [Prochilodus magdalenae]